MNAVCVRETAGHGRGLRPTLPSNAMDSLLERLERAHYCSTLRQQG